MKNFLIILTFLFTFLAPATAASTKTVMVFGDSLSASHGMPIEAGWVALLTQRLQTKFTDYQIINASISGETTLGGRNRIKQSLETHRPEIVILELGANDGLRGATIKSIYENLATIIEICQKNNSQVLLVGMQLPPNYGMTYTRKFQAIFPQLAENYQIKLIPFLLAGFGEKHEFFQADGIHPNEVAQKKIVETVWEVLQTMIKTEKIAANPDN
ncbi:MAG: arylesterase [Nitrosomonas sp.]|uniref:arylesterase n=1 Tax=Nitrosomonas sp. TaxID=42353 RepID=UPI0027157B14|nr:arylesterase [Nitrosomonas sp.]MDO8893939.1 arylesterase [Nitrosomonas sp.]MDO9470928.1 arylesterase [Nitrosomonas sp.]